MGVKATAKQEKYEKIKSIKCGMSPEDLCVDCPEEFTRFFHYVRDLEFEDRPDYSYLRGLFRDLYSQEFESDYEFDWMKSDHPY